MQSFRNMKKQDAEAVALLEILNFSDAWSVKSLLETYEQKQSFITIAEEDDTVIGYCIIYFALDEGEIARIAVHPKKQRRGVGKQLLDYTSEVCQEKGICRLMLDVRESNVTARRFYEQYGFAENGIRKKFYEKPKEDAILMSRVIG